MSKAIADIHDRTVPAIVNSIVFPTMEAGGTGADVMVVMESVMIGVLLVAVDIGGDELVLDTIVHAVKRRMAEIRLKHFPIGGTPS